MNICQLIRQVSELNITSFDFHFRLLVDLSRLFYSKHKKKSSHGFCDNFIQDHRNLCCKSCVSDLQCGCENHVIAKQIFLKHKVTFLWALGRVLSGSHGTEYLGLLFAAPYELCGFLRQVLSHKQLCEGYDSLWKLTDSKVDRAVLLACFVF